NAGSARLSADQEFQIEMHLTEGEGWDDNGIVLAQASVSGPAAVGEVRQETIVVDVSEPIIAGEYRIAALLDSRGQTDEADRANNTGWTSTGVRILPDLRPTAPEENSVAVMPGDLLTVDVAIENAGIGTLLESGVDVT